MQITTKRLQLREFQEVDWPAVHAYASEPAVARFQPWEPSTPARARGFVQHAIEQSQLQPRMAYLLAIVVSETQEVIGMAQLTREDQAATSGEIGYFLHPDYWGNGYAIEAAAALIDFGFATLKLQAITAQSDPRNHASIRVLARLDMHYERIEYNTMRIRDGWRDSVFYRLQAEEWAMST